MIREFKNTQDHEFDTRMIMTDNNVVMFMFEHEDKDVGMEVLTFANKPIGEIYRILDDVTSENSVYHYEGENQKIHDDYTTSALIAWFNLLYKYRSELFKTPILKDEKNIISFAECMFDIAWDMSYALQEHMEEIENNYGERNDLFYKAFDASCYAYEALLNEQDDYVGKISEIASDTINKIKKEFEIK